MFDKVEDLLTDPELNSRYWLVRKAVCLVGYYGGLRTNELRAIEFNKTFSGGERSFERDENGFWFSFERSKQRGQVELTTICVPRRTSDWVPVVKDSFRAPIDFDPASVIDEYLDVIQSDFAQSQEELSGPFFRSTHGVNGKKFRIAPLGINTLSKVPIEFAVQLLLPNSSSYTGHCWRRSCGTNASNAGVNVTTLMAQMGWSTPKTALGYVKRSKITSFSMSMFLSNIQRQNKVLDESGVRSLPVGPTVGKKDLPRVVSVTETEVGRGVRIPSAVDSGSRLAFHLISSGSSDRNVESDLVISELETAEASSASAEFVVAPVVHKAVVPVIADCEPISVAASSIEPASRLPDPVSSSSSFVTGMDPRVSAILQNFHNNGTVEIHFHFQEKK